MEMVHIERDKKKEQVRERNTYFSCPQFVCAYNTHTMVSKLLTLSIHFCTGKIARMIKPPAI